jgi:hypothetical protein
MAFCKIQDCNIRHNLSTQNRSRLLLSASKSVLNRVAQIELIEQVDRENILVPTLEIIDHIIRDGGDCLDCSTLDQEARLGTLRLPLGADDFTTRLGICLQLIVLCFPHAELLGAPGWNHMLHTDMDTLTDDAAIDLEQQQSIR